MSCVEKSIKFYLAGLLVFAMGCATKSKNDIDPVTGAVRTREMKMAEDFEAAGKLMDAGEFARAAAEYDRMAVEKPVSTLDGMVLFNSGICYIKTGDCQSAVERLRKAQRFAHKNVPGLEVRAKLRLTEAYTCLGQHKNALLLLLEVYKDRSLLPAEIGEAEVPARIAAAYAQNGNRKMAQDFFKKAERGLRFIEQKSKNSRDFQSTMARTLYMMGSLESVRPDKLDSREYFNAVMSLQKYLYRTVRSEQKPWNAQATDQIVNAYKATWTYVDAEPLPADEDVASARRAQKNARIETVMFALDALRALKREAIPERDPTPSTRALFAELNKEELRFKNYLTTEGSGTEFTPEAERLNSLKREGKVRSSETVLEKKQKRTKK